MMVKCRVEEDQIGNITVSFKNGKSIYLQSDSDRAQFLVQCGLVKAPDDWDGSILHLPDGWWEVDPTEITECLEDYEIIAE